MFTNTYIPYTYKHASKHRQPPRRQEGHQIIYIHSVVTQRSILHDKQFLYMYHTRARGMESSDPSFRNHAWTRCSTSLIIREIHIKTTMRHHLVPVRVAKINNSGNSRCCEDVGKREASCWWECKLVEPLRKTVWKFLKKLKIEGRLGGSVG